MRSVFEVFTAGTPSYEQNKERLLHQRWDKYNGNTVHRPKNMTAYEWLIAD